MRSYFVRTRCAFAGGELAALVGEKGSNVLDAGFDGRTRVQLVLERHVLELDCPADLHVAVAYLNSDIKQAIGDSLLSFCQVVAVGFMDWTAVVINTENRFVTQQESIVRKSGLDASLLIDPTQTDGKIEFCVRTMHDNEIQISKVRFDLNTATLEQFVLATWKGWRTLHLYNDTGEVFRIS